MIKIRIIGVMFLIGCCISCNKPTAPDCFKQAGTVIIEQRNTGPFHSVSLDGNLEVVLKKGTEHKVEIKGPANLLKKITTTVNSGTLTIDNNNGCNFVRGYKHHLLITVTSPRYDYVVTNSIGTIRTSDDFLQDSFYVRSEGGDIILNGNYVNLRTSSHGNGNVYFKGKTDQMFVYMNGTNYLYAEEGTVTSYLYVGNISLANAYVIAPSGGTLDYNISKSGNIYYSGSPASVQGKSDGTGALIKK